MNRLFTLIAIVLLLVSCGKDKNNESSENQVTLSEPTGAQTATVENDDESGNLLADPEKLQEAEDALRDLPNLKGKDLKVFQTLSFHGNGNITIDLQDPNKPENIDEYKYSDGKWGEPQPVQITGSGNLEDNLFDLNKTPFVTANKVYNTWEAKAKTLDDPVTDDCEYVYVNFWVPSQELSWYTSTMQTQRASYTLICALDGSELEFNKN